jgi:hypothetical protein
MKVPVKLTARRRVEFMEALKSVGGSSGNNNLMDRLGWSKELYDRVRDSLANELRAGPGYGGTVHLKMAIETQVKRGNEHYTKKRHDRAFIAMPIDVTDPFLEDLLETIKSAAEQCGIQASRIDEEQSNEKITDRILEAIKKARFVIVDLTKERPNVFFEAGYAHGIGKTPIYIAKEGTTFQFDVKDYPIITFKNMTKLREELVKRLSALRARRPSSPIKG